MLVRFYGFYTTTLNMFKYIIFSHITMDKFTDTSFMQKLQDKVEKSADNKKTNWKMLNNSDL